MFKDVPKLRDEYDNMVACNFTPIVLRFKLPCKTSRNIYGFYGFTVDRDEAMNGAVSITGRIDPDKTTAFFPDKFRIGYAVVPKCERNLEILTGLALTKDSPLTVEEPVGLIPEPAKQDSPLKDLYSPESMKKAEAPKKTRARRSPAKKVAPTKEAFVPVVEDEEINLADVL